MYTREVKFAYSWYPGETDVLSKTVKKMMHYNGELVDARGIMSPHAGIVYSGKTAGGVYARIKDKANVIVISPNHTGMGAQAAILREGEWKTPNRNIEINKELAGILIKESDILDSDTLAHANEHSIELQLPFLVERFENFKLVPITLKYLSFHDCEKLGKVIARVIKEKFPDTLIVASTDMSHGETLENTNKKDELALAKINKLDPKGLYDVVTTHDISMCGFIPSVIMLVATKELGATKALITEHTNSYKISGNKDYIVGYAGAIIY